MLEIACFTASSALSAARSGANRVELCTSYALGGLTPTLSTLSHVHSAISPRIPINIMIRPRAGNFTYSAAEFEAMRADIVRLKPFASGFVFGILDHAGKVDVARCCELLDLAEPLPCTFHRAVDEVDDLEGAVEMLVVCGFSSVLTSGGARSALEGKQRARALQEKFKGKISIILGGGIRAGNVKELIRETGVEWVHSAAITGEGDEVDIEEVKRLSDLFEDGVA